MNILRFLVALLVGALYRQYQDARGIWTALCDPGERVSPELAKARLESCAGCPVFFAPLQSCGSPLARDPRMGCHCGMSVKASVKTNCWATEQGYETFGWPKELNSYPIAQ